MHKSKAKQGIMYKSKAMKGTIYKGSKALCTKAAKLDVQREKSLEKLRKKKIKYVFRRVRTFPKYFSLESGSGLPFNNFKLPTIEYHYDATAVVLNQNQFLSKI